MNDPTKRIDVEKSSLLSLKAELLRKQEEVLKNKKSVPAFIKPSSKKSSEQVNKPESKKVPGAKLSEVEDSSLIAKSRKVLEAKAKYYDRMMKSKGGINSDDNSLVLFNKKTQFERNYSDEEDDGMVEYTDCFGRSRRIARKDLDKVKEQDEELSTVAEAREEQIIPNRDVPDSPQSTGELSDDDEPPIGPDIGLQFMKQREEWEKQEELNRERTNIHYRDILFDEAREHGVGFYEFSTDHEERQKQQEALSKIRDSTLEAQQQRADLKKSRDDIIANRVKLAKARVRVRLGLPPEKEKPAENENLYDTTDKKKEKEEEAAKKKAEIEKKKERERQKHIRPWDKHKISSSSRRSSTETDSDSDEEKEWEPRRETRPMTQEEWNEKQRAERKQEFAPMGNNFVRAQETYNPNNFEEDKDEKSLFFSSKTSKTFKRRNQSPEHSSESSSQFPRGAAIPPPATFEYFGPSATKHPKSRQAPANLEESISAGLKYLREQVDKGNKHKWSAANEYVDNS